MFKITLLAIAMSACGGSRTAPAPVGNERTTNPAAGECATTADALSKSMQVKKGAAEPGKLEATIAERCVEDEWNTALRRCMSSATSEADRGECTDSHLTNDQQKKLTAAVEPYVESQIALVMAQFQGFAEKMCACKDARCAQDVSDEMTKWSQNMARTQREPPKMTEADQKRAAEVGERMGKCMQTVMTPAAAPLQVTSIDPASGDAKGGTQVKIVGTGFVGDGQRTAKVYFGAKEGKVVRVASDTELLVEAPAGKPKDVVDVRVVFSPGGEHTLPKAYTFAKKR